MDLMSAFTGTDNENSLKNMQTGLMDRRHGVLTLSLLDELRRSPTTVVLNEKALALEAQLRENAREKDQMSAELEYLRSENEFFRRQQDIVRTKIESHTAKIQSEYAQPLSDMVEVTERMYSTLQKLGDNATGCVIKLRAENMAVKEKLMYCEKQLETANNTAALHDEEMSILMQRLDTRNKEFHALQEKSSADKAQLQDEIERLICNSESSSSAAGRQIEQLKRMLADSEEHSNAVEERIKTLTGSLDELTLHHAEDLAALGAKQATVDDLTAKLNTANHELAQLREKLTISKATEDSLMSQIREQKSSLSEKEMMGEELRRLHEGSDALDAENKRLKEALANYEASDEGLKEHISKLQKQVCDQHETIESLRAEKCQVEAELVEAKSAWEQSETAHVSKELRMEGELAASKLRYESLLKDTEYTNREQAERENRLENSNGDLERRNAQLLRSIEILEKQNDSLVNENDRVKTLNESLQAKVKEMESTVNANFTEIDELNRSYQKLNEEKNSVSGTVEMLTGQMMEKEKIIERQNEQLKEADAKLRQIEFNLEQKIKENELLSVTEKNQSDLTKELIETRARMSYIDTEKSRLEDSNAKLQTRLKDAEQGLENSKLIEANLQLVSNENDQLKSERAELVSIASAFNLEIFDLKDHFIAMQDENDKLKSRIETLEEEYTESEQTIHALEKTKSVLQERLQSIQTHNAETLRAEKSAFMRAKNETESEITGLRQLIDSLRETCESKDTELASLTRELTEKQRLLEDTSELTNLQAQIQELNEVNAKGFAHTEILREELTKLRRENEEKTDLLRLANEEKREINELITQINQLGEDKREMVQILGPLNTEIYDLRSGLQNIGKMYCDVMAERDRLIAKTDELASSNVYLKSALDDSQAQLTHLYSEIEKKENELTFIKKSPNQSAEDLKREIVNLYAELNERRMRDGITKQTEQERNELLSDVADLELHIYNLETNTEAMTEERQGLLGRISQLQDDLEKQKTNWMTAVQALENDKAEMQAVIERKTFEVQELLNSPGIEEVQKKLESTMTEKDMILKRLEMATTEKELIARQLNDNEKVNAEIERVTSELDYWKRTADSLQEESNKLKAQNLSLSSQIPTQEDRDRIDQLEMDKIILQSQISSLEHSLQLKILRQKGDEARAHEQQLKLLTNENQDLMTKLSNNEQTNRDLSEKIANLEREKNRLDLQFAELEGLVASSQQEKAELEMLKHDFEALTKQNEFLKGENQEMETIREQMNALDLRAEALDHELDEFRQENAKLQETLDEQIGHNDELRSLLADLEVKNNQSDVDNLQQRSQIVKKQAQISELESRIRILLSEKESFQNTIDELNTRHQTELRALAAKTEPSVSGTSQIEIVTVLNEKNAELIKKERALRAELTNEAADHFTTKKRFDEQQRNYTELVAKYRTVDTNHSCLVKTLTDLFGCMPAVASIIGAASLTVRENKELKGARAKSSSQEVELAQTRYQLSQTRHWLELERKKSQLEATRRSNPHHTLEVTGIDSGCIEEFLNTFANSTFDINAKAMASVLLANITRKSPMDAEMWRQFAREISSSERMKQLVVRFEQRANETMTRMMGALKRNEGRCESILARVKFIATKSQRQVRKKRQSMPPPEEKPTASLYERSLRPRVPGRDVAVTPFANRKSSRVPLGPVTNTATPSLPARIEPRLGRHSIAAGTVLPSINSHY